MIFIRHSETEHDEKAREFIFADLTDSEDLREEIRQELWDDSDFRDEIMEKLIDDPPGRLRRAIVDELIDDPPEKLVGKIKERLKEEQEDTIGDLKLTIASLEERRWTHSRFSKSDSMLMVRSPPFLRGPSPRSSVRRTDTPPSRARR